MVVLTVVFIILTFLTIDLVVQRATLARARADIAARARATAKLPLPQHRLDEAPASVHLDPGHIWVEPEPEGTVRLGIDALAATLIGAPDWIEVEPPGSHVRPGERVATLHRGRRRLDLKAPLGGHVDSVNLEVVDEPRAAAVDPFGRGWLVRLEPDHQDATGHLLRGLEARSFLAAEARRLGETLARMAPRPAGVGATLLDGGVPDPDLARELDDPAWQELADGFLGQRREGGER